MSNPKRHHLVPEFYLRRFADQKEQVTAVRRDTGKSIPKIGVRNVAVESQFYTLEQLENLPPSFAENTLQLVEDETAKALQRIDAGQFPPNGPDRLVLSLYLALQITRSREFRDGVERRSDMLLRARWFLNLRDMSNDQVHTFLREHLGIEPTDEDVAEMVDVRDRISDFRLIPHQDTSISLMFATAMEMVPYLSQRSWSLMAFKKRVFLTSDRPVVLWRKRDMQNPVPGVGVANADDVYFPLDPTKVLVLTLNPTGLQPIIPVLPHIAKMVNRLVANNCYDWIFHDPRHTPLEGIDVPRERPEREVNGIRLDDRGDVWERFSEVLLR